MRLHVFALALGVLIGVPACVAPGIQGPGGTVQGTANVENLERQSPVTPAPDDSANAANAAIYGSGRGYYPWYYRGRCRGAPCYRSPYWY